jgi:hypothetical protein
MKENLSPQTLSTEGAKQKSEILSSVRKHLDKKGISSSQKDFLYTPYLEVDTPKYQGMLFVELKGDCWAVVNLFNGKRTPWGAATGINRFVVGILIQAR